VNNRSKCGFLQQKEGSFSLSTAIIMPRVSKTQIILSLDAFKDKWQG
jgi:hypothetical protein